MGLTSSGRRPKTVTHTLASLVLEIITLIDDSNVNHDFSMTGHGIDQTLSDSDPDIVGVAQEIYRDITMNRNSDTHGDYSYAETYEGLDPIAQTLAEVLENMDLFDPLPALSAKTEDGRYGADEKHQMWKIHSTYSGIGYVVGNIMDLENIEYAAEMADEESRVLMMQAREEFGF